MNLQATQRAIDAAWRNESAKLVAVAARITHDLGLAEDAAQDALVSALEHWPRDGVPDNPAAWLMTAAKRRALDRLRHAQLADGKHAQIAHEMDALQALVVPDFVDALDAARQDDIGDDLLRLVFTACHPVLSVEARVALTLKLLAGLTTAEIARAYLVGEPTVAQRIVRAKRTIAAANLPYEVPRGDALHERLASVLEVIYLIFNEGYTATSGSDWMRPALAGDALRLGRLLAELMPDEPEVLGLVALMELQASRSPARTDAAGRPVLLADQDRSRWDRASIERGLAALERADAVCRARAEPHGPYTLQAAIAACHARAPDTAATDWAHIVALYGALAVLQPSPVVELNRAVAVSMADGPAAALPLVEALLDDARLAAYHWLPSVHGDLLARLGRSDDARRAFERAAGLAQNERERELLLERAAQLAPTRH